MRTVGLQAVTWTLHLFATSQKPHYWSQLAHCSNKKVKSTLLQGMLGLSQPLDQFSHVPVAQTLSPSVLIHTSCSWPSPQAVGGGRKTKQLLRYTALNPILLESDPSCTCNITHRLGVLSIQGTSMSRQHCTYNFSDNWALDSVRKGSFWSRSFIFLASSLIWRDSLLYLKQCL